MYSSSQPLHHAQHKICPVFFHTATPHCSPQNMPCILPHSHSTLLTTKYAMYSSSQPLHTAHHKICHVILLTVTKRCCLFLLTTKYAIHSSAQPLHTPHHKICNIFFLTATPQSSAQVMPFTIPRSHSPLLTTRYATYSSPELLHSAVYFCSPHNMPCIFPQPPHTAVYFCSPQNFPCILPHSHSKLLSIFAHRKICHVYPSQVQKIFIYFCSLDRVCPPAKQKQLRGINILLQTSSNIGGLEL